ncbi:MAG: UDPGP type 1 family protein [Lentisphaeria bacterium]|jgi:UDP-N-acetylglucosamine/UDP-N-acetylgalactosamine diphosphorylase
MTTPTKESLLALVQPHGQEHLLRFWDQLAEAGRAQLADQLLAIDWESFDGWVTDYVLAPKSAALPADLKPAPSYPLAPRGPAEAALYEGAVRRGQALLKQGKVAGFTVAGGQGTRLGYDGPKGTFPVTPIHNKPLFQVFAETILRTQEKAGSPIPWYIMTSPINDGPTREFFQANGFFGLNPAKVKFFTQGTMPAIGLDGKLLLASPDSLALSPNGHGGCLLAMRQSGMLQELAAAGIEHISYWQIDNPLVQMFDPLFLGLHDLTESDMSSRGLVKTGPLEKLGNYALADGKLTIIEYSDMPEELARAKGPDGRLRFRVGSPAIHLLRRDFVERLTAGGRLQLPFHRAVKKVPAVDANGQVAAPAEPNAVKLEMFIFDALPLANRPLILEADRDEQFAPVKNPTGVDSLESSQKMQQERAARWLEAAGVTVPRRADGTLDCTLELSPRRFADRADVVAAAGTLPTPEPGAALALD